MTKITPNIGNSVRLGATPSPPQTISDKSGNVVRIEVSHGVSTDDPGVVKTQGATS